MKLTRMWLNIITNYSYACIDFGQQRQQPPAESQQDQGGCCQLPEG